MNIWALDKHQDIRHVLLLLIEQLGPDAFSLDATRTADPRTIYLLHNSEPGVRAWLHILGQSEGCYGVHLEYPNAIDIHENLKLPALVATLAAHFDVPVIQALP